MYSFHQEKCNNTIPPEEIAKLLRSIGASGRLVGFNYVVLREARQRVRQDRQSVRR